MFLSDILFCRQTVFYVYEHMVVALWLSALTGLLESGTMYVIVLMIAVSAVYISMLHSPYDRERTALLGNFFGSSCIMWNPDYYLDQIRFEMTRGNLVYLGNLLCPSLQAFSCLVCGTQFGKKGTSC